MDVESYFKDFSNLSATLEYIDAGNMSLDVVEYHKD